MEKTALIGIILCMLLFFPVSVVLGNTDDVAQQTKSHTGSNLLPNPSFEEGDTMPTGWTFDPETQGIYHWDSEYALSGEKSVGVLNLTSPFQERLTWRTIDFIPVDLGNYTYLFYAWYKFIGEPSLSMSAMLYVFEYDSNHSLIFWYGTGKGNVSSDWYQVSMQVHDMGRPVSYVKLEVGLVCSTGEYGPDPSVEVRFDDVFFGYGNTPPNQPTITGETSGRVGETHIYFVSALDVNQDPLTFFIDWGDGLPRKYGHDVGSGDVLTVSHTWWTTGIHTIRVKAVDVHNAESNWTTLPVTMPFSYNIPVLSFWEWLSMRFPNAFPILYYLLGGGK